jgi:hypothetical protein
VDGQMRGGSAWIMSAVLRFFSREDEDPLDSCLLWSGRSVEFRTVPSAKSNERDVRDHRISWNSVARNHDFSDRLILEGARKICNLLPSWQMF